MFFSRPQIDLLNWDLQSLPEFDYSRTFTAKTTDGKILSFRFGGGWLSARYCLDGEPNNFFQMNNKLFEGQVCPNFFDGILPEQICDLFGLTVSGRKVSAVDISTKKGSRKYFDFSGQMTYWQSSHLSCLDETSDIIEKMTAALPQSVIFHINNHSDQDEIRYEAVDLSVSTDAPLLIGLGRDKLAIEAEFKANPLRKPSFPLLLSYGYNKLAQPDFLRENGNFQAEMAAIKRQSFFAAFSTADVEAKSQMEKVINILDTFFLNTVKVFNLKTKEPIDPRPNGLSSFSYSHELKEWCLEKDNRFMQVGVLPTDGQSVFYGLRPR